MRLLTFNCHEAWVHQLGLLERPIDVIDGLAGRYAERWDDRMRPVPQSARLIDLATAQRSTERYDCIIGHNLTDLLEVKALDAPRILVLHVTLDHRVHQAGLKQAPADLRDTIARYLAYVGGHAVAVTAMKRDNWQLGGSVVESAADPEQYRPWTGHIRRGLRVANQIQARRQYLYWDFHEAAFGSRIPIDILGHNPEMGVEPAASWDALKHELAAHRFFVHTADPALEDGFNMALIEALAAGVPIIGNRHPTSPIEDGVQGLLADSPQELAGHAERLLADDALAKKMSENARQLAQDRFSPGSFVSGFERAIASARLAWQERTRP